MKVIACIPARYGSGRLPGKPLCLIADKPLILHVVERVQKAQFIDEVVVLTDDERILNTVMQAGHQAYMTSESCRNGTERLIDYLNIYTEEAIFLNVQGDELLISPTHLDQLITNFKADKHCKIATLARWVEDPQVLQDPSTVKVVTDHQDNAMYFSRHCIPVRQSGELPDKALVHTGVYIYRRDALLHYAELPASPLETTEALEQLRALSHGITIKVVKVENHHHIAIDTMVDVEKARALLS